MMDEDESMRPPHEVDVLDDNYLRHWETSVGREMMPSFITDLRGDFDATYNGLLQDIQAACEHRQADALIKHTHYIKGSLGNMGLSRAAAFARQAEVELLTDQFDRFESYPQHLDRHIQEGLAALRERYQ